MTRSKDIFFEERQGQLEGDGAAAQAEAEYEMYQQGMYEQSLINASTTIFEQGITKRDVPTIAEMMISHVLEVGNPLHVAENIKVLETLIDAMKNDKRFKDYALEEVAKYGKSFTSARGVKIELCEVGTKYDYSKCGDPILFDLEMQNETLTKKIKNRQDFLKALPIEGVETLIGDELVRLYPPSKTSTSSYKITLPK